MKQKLVIVVVAVVALGAGFAGGFILADKKGKAAVLDVQTKMQQSEAAYRSRVSNYDNIVNKLSGELQIAKLEIEGLKSQAAPQAESSPVVLGQPAEMPDGPSEDGSLAQGGTRVYTIQSGDSFWSIAQKQLGNGSRYTEILKLNPKLTEKSRLVVGSRLTLPAK